MNYSAKLKFRLFCGFRVMIPMTIDNQENWYSINKN